MFSVVFTNITSILEFTVLDTNINYAWRNNTLNKYIAFAWKLLVESHYAFGYSVTTNVHTFTGQGIPWDVITDNVKLYVMNFDWMTNRFIWYLFQYAITICQNPLPLRIRYFQIETYLCNTHNLTKTNLLYK